MEGCGVLMIGYGAGELAPSEGVVIKENGSQTITSQRCRVTL